MSNQIRLAQIGFKFRFTPMIYLMNLDESDLKPISGRASRFQIRVESGRASRVQIRAELGQVGQDHLAGLI